VIRNDNSVITVPLKDLHNPPDIHVAIINEAFFIERGFAANVAEVNICDFTLAAVRFNRLIDICAGHFGKCADAEFEGIGWTGVRVQQLLVKVRAVDQSRLAADDW
jgi:hypothetical protein